MSRRKPKNVGAGCQDSADNSQEFRAGTNPRDSASALRLTISLYTNATQVAFPAGSNRAYTLQFRDRLDPGSWQDLEQFRPAATNRLLYYHDPLPGTPQPASIASSFRRAV